MAVYLDCNATTPIEPEVSDIVRHYMEVEFGNAGSRTHSYGAMALQAVQQARRNVAEVVTARQDEVIFTSGATESNNLAILGLVSYGERVGKRHIITSMMEHKAVLEPLTWLTNKGFEVTFLPADYTGRVHAIQIKESLRSDTLLVSVMHVNNETGVIQPIQDIADVLEDHDAFFHVDAAQGFGKVLSGINNQRVDLISISGHKIYGPKGIGALVARRRSFKPLPLEPIMLGGGQERGLRPGTLPVPLVAGLGKAAEMCYRHHETRTTVCSQVKDTIVDALLSLQPVIIGDPDYTVSHTLSISLPGLDSEAVIVALKDEIAISNGSACTSHSYRPSHVLQAMQLPPEVIQGTLRISWSHMTQQADWQRVVEKLKRMM